MLKKENAQTETVHTFFIQKLYKMYPTDVYKMHTKCIYTIFRQAFVYILCTKSKELCQLNFVYKMYTKVCWNVRYILYTSILIYLKRTSLTLCIYTTYIQNSYKMYINNCIQNGSLISTYFDLFVVHFLVNHCKQLRLETCWLIIGGIYKINGLLNYIFH